MRRYRRGRGDGILARIERHGDGAGVQVQRLTLGVAVDGVAAHRTAERDRAMHADLVRTAGLGFAFEPGQAVATFAEHAPGRDGRLPGRIGHHARRCRGACRGSASAHRDRGCGPPIPPPREAWGRVGWGRERSSLSGARGVLPTGSRPHPSLPHAVHGGGGRAQHPHRKTPMAVSPRISCLSGSLSWALRTTLRGSGSPIGNGWSEPSMTRSAPAFLTRNSSPSGSNITVSYHIRRKPSAGSASFSGDRAWLRFKRPSAYGSAAPAWDRTILAPGYFWA